MSNNPISLSAAIDAEEERRASRPPTLFDPRVEVSADAKYIVKHLVLWFLALPLAVGLLIWALVIALR